MGLLISCVFVPTQINKSLDSNTPQTTVNGERPDIDPLACFPHKTCANVSKSGPPLTFITYHNRMQGAVVCLLLAQKPFDKHRKRHITQPAERAI